MKIVVVEDHMYMLESLVEYLKMKLPDQTNIYGFIDGKQAEGYIEMDKDIDVLLTDLNVPGMSGLDLIRSIRSNNPHMKIIVLTMYFSKELLHKLEALNVNGYLLKNLSRDEIYEAIKKVLDEGKYIASGIDFIKDKHRVISKGKHLVKDDFVAIQSLSQRERDVCLLMLNNMSNTEIGDELGIGTETVKSYRKNVYGKLNVNNVLDLYKLAVASGFL